MFNIVKARYPLLLAACAIGLAGCGKSADDAKEVTPLTDTAGLLRYVPADTPYVFGTLAPPPDEFMDKIEPKLDRLLAAYAKMLEASVAAAKATEESESEDIRGSLLPEVAGPHCRDRLVI